MDSPINLYSGLESAEHCRRLGWGGVCAALEYGGGFRKAYEDAKSPGDGMLVAAVLTKSIQRDARRAMDSADLVIADCRSDDSCREASESWEVDLMVNAELTADRDMIRQRSSGLDHVMAAYMAERGIGYIVNFDNILSAGGVRRAQTAGRAAQNAMLAAKYGVNVVFACGRSSKWEARGPLDLASLGIAFGVRRNAALDAVFRNPHAYARRANDRADPDVILDGLVVKSWGRQEKVSKRRWGWY